MSGVTVNDIWKITFEQFDRIERLKILQLRIPKASKLKIFFITRRRKMCSIIQLTAHYGITTVMLQTN